MINKEKINLIKKIITPDKNIVITIHANPDGDAVGGALALQHFFKQKGNNVNICSPNELPKNLKWLSEANTILNYFYKKKKIDKIFSEADIIFCVDYNGLGRINNMKEPVKKSNATKIMLDHHPEPENFVDYMFSNTEVSSAAELCYYFLENYSKELINKTIAECLFTGIVTDTGSFQYSSATSTTFKTAAKLLDCKIDKQKIFNNIYSNYSADRMKLMGYLLDSKMVVLPSKKIAYISITLQEFEKYNYKTGDHENFVNLPLSIEGITFSVLFMEKDDEIRVSLRSVGDEFDVNKIARKYFKGGGHKNAAGGYSKLNMEETISYFKDIVKTLSGEKTLTI